LSLLELIPIRIPGQPDLAISALIAVDLGTTEGDAFAIAPADPQVQVRTRDENLIGPHPRIPEDGQARYMYTRKIQEKLIRNSPPPPFRKTGVDKIDQPLTRLAPQEEGPRPTGVHSTIMVLAQRMVVVENGQPTLVVVE
jgi:hypothetical protein